jgi:hypothetical protein
MSEVAVVGAMTCRQKAPLRWTLYPLTPETASVDAGQATLI